jgi:short-subunit dehydrogenase
MSTPVAWITGASRGIGRATAIKFARNGAIVALSSRSRKDLDALETELTAEGIRAVAVPCDMTNAAAINSAHAYIVQEIGPVDILVNNAGISIFKSFLDTSLDEFDNILNTNFRGAIIASKAVLPSMLEQKRGYIFNIISITVRKIFTNSAAYAASKASLATAMDILREEIRGTGIKVINIIPGATDTAIWPQKTREKYRERMLQPEIVANTILSVYNQPPEAGTEEIVIRPTGGDL